MIPNGNHTINNDNQSISLSAAWSCRTVRIRTRPHLTGRKLHMGQFRLAHNTLASHALRAKQQAGLAEKQRTHDMVDWTLQGVWQTVVSSTDLEGSSQVNGGLRERGGCGGGRDEEREIRRGGGGAGERQWANTSAVVVGLGSQGRNGPARARSAARPWPHWLLTSI